MPVNKTVKIGWKASYKGRRKALEGDATELPFRNEEEIIEEQPPRKKRQLSLEDITVKTRRLFNEGATLAESERYAEAHKKWDEALQLTEDAKVKGEILEAKAQVLLEMERPFQAITCARKSLESRPKWIYGLLTLGRALLAFGELKEAKTVFAAVVKSEAPKSDRTVKKEAQDELYRVAVLQTEISDAAKDRSTAISDASKGRGTVVNGRVVSLRFWETARNVTYKDGRPIVPD
eukprot:GEMP01101508.1.p1 GENE.GEMP01101508.1~~GEMP01101508.1.p1  ORF type:complete len:235 (+),score=68.48 GEMP01101508.1:49-753(+)